MRTFEGTHHWITFRVDLSRTRSSLWILLGEAASKFDHLGRVPLRPATAKKMHHLYLAKGVAATTAIEGNTLSEAEVLAAVEGSLQVPPSKAYLKQEVENLIAACNDIGKQVAKKELPALTPEVIRGYNRQVLVDLPLREGVVPGQIRGWPVVVGNVYRGAPSEDCEFLLGRLCEWLDGPDFDVDELPLGVRAILKAVLAHLYVAWIHPFGDGNGRTARLLEFHLLLAAGAPSPAAHLLSNHYNQTRAEYYHQLDRASKSGGDVVPFLTYAVQGLVDGLRSQLEYVWEQQSDVVWRNYVHELFHGKATPSEKRQHGLALDLGARRDWVEVGAVPQLSIRLAGAYATKTSKTVQRDLALLEKHGLIERNARRVRARRELIQSFLPLRVDLDDPSS